MLAPRVLLLSLLLAATSSYAEQDFTNFRVGVGSYSADLAGGPQWMPDGSQAGFSVFAEFPQSNIAASRFILYRINGEDGVRLQGGETQLMWGWGLAQSGPPDLHRAHLAL